MTGTCWQVVRCVRRVRDVVVTNVIGNVLTDKQVVRVIGALVGLALGEGTGVEDFKGANTALNSSVYVGVFVFNKLLFEALNLIVITEIGVGIERAVTLDLLRHGASADAPVVIDVPLG